MAKRFFAKYDYDIAFDEEVGTNLISWNTGLMVFFVTLTLAVNLMLSSMSKTWVEGLSGALTIEVRPPLVAVDTEKNAQAVDEEFKNKIKDIMSMLRKNIDVKETRLLADSEVRDLIKPWMGDNIALETMPLPTLIDVRINEGANVTQLKLDLTKIEPSATIDSHSDTIKDIQKVMNTASGFVSLLTILIVFLATISISGIIRSKLMIHRDEVETLHLIGASNEYIARQFRHHTLNKTIKGAVVGMIFTIVTLLIIGSVTETLNASVISYMQVMPWHWLLLAIAPVVLGAVIAHLTAQAASLRELSKLP